MSVYTDLLFLHGHFVRPEDLPGLEGYGQRYRRRAVQAEDREQRATDPGRPAPAPTADCAQGCA